ncbi:MAG: WXG100 family type VII secretion target [Clostridia bacterium]|nr:WXG100 family type VII secretion target [Clostridia bacterium]
MATINVTPRELMSAASRIQDLAGEYQNQYKAVYQRTEEMGSTWKDEANRTFIRRIEGFQDDLNKMYDLMNDYAEYLQKAADAYERTQKAVIDAAQKLAN